jgi:hypothetical protein
VGGKWVDVVMGALNGVYVHIMGHKPHWIVAIGIFLCILGIVTKKWAGYATLVKATNLEFCRICYSWVVGVAIEDLLMGRAWFEYLDCVYIMMMVCRSLQLLKNCNKSTFSFLIQEFMCCVLCNEVMKKTI